MKMSMAFANLVQTTEEDRAAVTNLTTANRTLAEQVALYTNHYRRVSEKFQVRWLIYGLRVGGRYSNLG